ncbi:MAG: type II secretion system F family protein [bacterium]|nr:type II secretion system F family protein [bacterium]
MKEFVYRAREKRTGRWRDGVISADDENTVVRRLQEQELIVVSIKERKVYFDINTALINLQRISLRDLVVFTRQFATMIRAGVALVRALGILSQETRNLRLKLAIEDIRKEVESGTALSQALAKHRDIFPRLYISLVRVGETGGILDIIFDRLATYYEKNEEITRKIKSAAAYPIAIIVLAIAMVIFLLTYVLPTFLNLLMTFETPIPLPTRIVMGASSTLRNYWYVIFSVIIVLYLLFRLVTSKPKGRELWDKFKLRIPIIGRIQKLTIISRLCHTLSILISGGVPIITALDVVRETLDSVPYMNAIEEARRKISEGEQLSATFIRSNLFPPMLGYMTAVGEESGLVDEMLNRVGIYYDSELDALITTLTSLLEPILIIFVGGLVGFIVISMYMPIFQIIQTLSR